MTTKNGKKLLPIHKQFIEQHLVYHYEFSDSYLCKHIYTQEDVLIEKFFYSFPCPFDLSNYISAQTMNRKILASVSTMLRTFTVIRETTFTWYVSEHILGDFVDIFINGQSMPISQIKYLFFLMAQTVQILHGHRLSINDWRPKNIMMSSTMVKFINYAGLHSIETVSNDDTIAFLGDPRWMAPEMLLSDSYSLVECDIWCLGLYLHYMATGKPLFENSDTLYSTFQNFEYIPNENMDPKLSDLLLNILTIDPLKRLSIRSILNHPFLMPTVPFPIYPIPLETSETISAWLEFFNLDRNDITDKLRSYACEDSTMLFHFLISASEKGISPNSNYQEKEKSEKEIILQHTIFPEKLDFDDYLNYVPKIESFSQQNLSPRQSSSVFISMPYSTKTRSPISTSRPVQMTKSINELSEDYQQEDVENEIFETKKEKRSKELSKLLKVCSDGLEKKGMKVQHLQSYIRNSQGFPR